jgi:hypothetical protein
LEGSDESSRPRHPTCPAISERHPSVGRLLELLQDQPQRLLKQVRHQLHFEGCPEHSTGAEDAQDVCGEQGPITRGSSRLRRRFVCDVNDGVLAIGMVQEID